jgi:hypothetical protein
VSVPGALVDFIRNGGISEARAIVEALFGADENTVSAELPALKLAKK